MLLFEDIEKWIETWETIDKLVKEWKINLEEIWIITKLEYELFKDIKELSEEILNHKQ